MVSLHMPWYKPSNNLVMLPYPNSVYSYFRVSALVGYVSYYPTDPQGNIRGSSAVSILSAVRMTDVEGM